MALIGIRAGLTEILAAPLSPSAASKSLLQINLNRLFPMQAAFISGSVLKDKSKERPAPLP
jgi:hypothetical protein